jgi:hypothetical protein
MTRASFSCDGMRGLIRGQQLSAGRALINITAPVAIHAARFLTSRRVDQQHSSDMVENGGRCPSGERNVLRCHEGPLGQVTFTCQVAKAYAMYG